MSQFLQTSLQYLSVQSIQTAHTNLTCVVCNKDASVFRSELDQLAYSWNGLCQKCQDEVEGI